MKRKDIERLQTAGLISAEQAVAIAEHFHLNGNRGRQWMVWSMSSLAGLLILGGIIMLVSANWEIIPDLMKMGTAMALLLGIWIAWARTRETHPLIAEGLGLVGGGMWLACISLHGQMFQLQNPFVEGCALFFVGVVALPFLVRLRVLLLVVAVASAVLLGAMADNNGSWLSLHSWLEDDSEMMAAFALLAMLWWVLAERWRGAAGVCRSYTWLSIPAMLSFLFMVQVPLFYQCIHPDLENWQDALPVVTMLVVVPILLSVLKPKEYSWSCWWLMVLLLSVPLPLGLTMYSGSELLGVLCGFGMGGGLMYLGHRARRIAWLNYGSLIILLAGIALVANVLESLTGSGLVLIIAGLVMLGLVWLLEKQRRMLVKAIKEEK